jgi:hypothetical protein
MTKKFGLHAHRQGQLPDTICSRSYKEHSFRPDLPISEGFSEWTNVSGLPHPVKIYELWCTVPARGMKNTLSLSSTSRDKLSRENAHNARSPITLQENLLTVIMPNLCARDTGFPQLLNGLISCVSPHLQPRHCFLLPHTARTSNAVWTYLCDGMMSSNCDDWNSGTYLCVMLNRRHSTFVCVYVERKVCFATLYQFLYT